MKNQTKIIVGSTILVVALAIVGFFGWGIYSAGCYNEEINKKIDESISKKTFKADSFKDAKFFHIRFEDELQTLSVIPTKAGPKFKVSTVENDDVYKALENEPSDQITNYMDQQENIVYEDASDKRSYVTFDPKHISEFEETCFMASVGFWFRTNVVGAYSEIAKKLKELAAKVDAKDKPTLFGIVNPNDITFFFHTDKKEDSKKLKDLSTTNASKESINKNFLPHDKVLTLLFGGTLSGQQTPSSLN